MKVEIEVVVSGLEKLSVIITLNPSLAVKEAPLASEDQAIVTDWPLLPCLIIEYCGRKISAQRGMKRL